MWLRAMCRSWIAALSLVLAAPLCAAFSAPGLAVHRILRPPGGAEGRVLLSAVPSRCSMAWLDIADVPSVASRSPGRSRQAGYRQTRGCSGRTTTRWSRCIGTDAFDTACSICPRIPGPDKCVPLLRCCSSHRRRVLAPCALGNDYFSPGILLQDSCAHSDKSKDHCCTSLLLDTDDPSLAVCCVFQ